MEDWRQAESGKKEGGETADKFDRVVFGAHFKAEVAARIPALEGCEWPVVNCECNCTVLSLLHPPVQ